LTQRRQLLATVVQQFAALLAAEENPAERAALTKRAQMLAMNEAAPEAFEPPVSTSASTWTRPSRFRRRSSGRPSSCAAR
jgi:hypothetical protein